MMDLYFKLLLSNGNGEVEIDIQFARWEYNNKS